MNRLFSEFELPLLPTLVVGCALLIFGVLIVHECTSNPWDDAESLQAEGCEFVDGTLFAPGGAASPAVMSAAQRMAAKAGIEKFEVKASYRQ